MLAQLDVGKKTLNNKDTSFLKRMQPIHASTFKDDVGNGSNTAQPSASSFAAMYLDAAEPCQEGRGRQACTDTGLEAEMQH